MLVINKKYVVDDNNRPVAVQLDLKTFERMEQLLEDYALGQFMEENDPNDALSLNEAKAFYQTLSKKE